MRSFHRFGPVPGSRPASWRRVARLLPIFAAIPLLFGGCALIVVRERPILDTNLYEARNTVTPPTAEALALIQAGVALDRQHPEWAITYFRDAAIRVLPQALDEGVSPGLDLDRVERRPGGLSAGHRILAGDGPSAGEVREWLLGRRPRPDGGRRPGQGRASTTPRGGKRSCRRAGSRSRDSATRMGKGVSGRPSSRHLTLPGKWGEIPAEATGAMFDRSERHFPRSNFRAASATLRPGTGANEPLAVLELHDPVLEPDMHWQSASADTSVPLAYDMTVPLARQLHVTNLNLIGALAVLNPDSYNNRTGIYMLDPYVPGKIPVVLVHGLMSSPAAWTNAMNDLRGDPELRKRYQFWMFFYSTGNPLLASGARFRKALGDLRAELDPEHQDPAFDHMVLIGHSMGGLMSRLAISRSGQILWNTAAKVPPDQVQLDPDLKDLLMQAMFFEPEPMVSRVVFVSTPHRGSPMGDELVGRLSSRLIRVPGNILEIRKTLAQLNGDADVSQAFRGTRYATGVAQLGLGNPVLQAINELPLSDRVPYHSIVGYNGKEPLPAGGDGVVPYTSAHVEGALSELIVSSDHSAQETEAGIQEMRRILTLHFNEYALERKALAAGANTRDPDHPSQRPDPGPLRARPSAGLGPGRSHGPLRASSGGAGDPLIKGLGPLSRRVEWSRRNWPIREFGSSRMGILTMTRRGLSTIATPCRHAGSFIPSSGLEHEGLSDEEALRHHPPAGIDGRPRGAEPARRATGPFRLGRIPQARQEPEQRLSYDPPQPSGTGRESHDSGPGRRALIGCRTQGVTHVQHTAQSKSAFQSFFDSIKSALQVLTAEKVTGTHPGLKSQPALGPPGRRPS